MSQFCQELLIGQISDYPLQTSTDLQFKAVHTGDTLRISSQREPPVDGRGFAGEFCWSTNAVTKIAFIHLCSESAIIVQNNVVKPAVWNSVALTPN